MTEQEIIKTFAKKRVRSVTINKRKDGTIMIYFVQNYKRSDNVGWLSIKQAQEWLDSSILSLEEFKEGINEREETTI